MVCRISCVLTVERRIGTEIKRVRIVSWKPSNIEVSALNAVGQNTIVEEYCKDNEIDYKELQTFMLNSKYTH